MALSDVQARTTITGFSATDEAIILGAIQNAYNGSSLAKTMFDNWIATPTNMIQIQYEKGKAYSRNSPSGQVFLDLQLVSTINYITPTGQSIEVDPVHVVVHELGHALTGRSDSELEIVDNGGFLTDYKGENVIYTNPMLAQLGTPERLSYIGTGLDAASGGVLDRNFQYTNGVAIDRAVSRDSDWSMSLLTLFSKDLLIGGSSANILQSGFGDDFLWGAGGDDKLYGGFGTDTAGFKGKPTDYDLRLNPDETWTSRHVRGSVNEGTDTLTNVDKVMFEGGQTFDLKKKGLTYQFDFALVIDTTGSMGDDIDAVKANGAAIINALFADDTKDARIGIVGFKDTEDGEPTSIILPFTDQENFADRKAAALTALNGITVDGGGDLPETAFDGLLKALNGTMGNWRPGAGIHRVVLFTDAAAKDGSLAGAVAALAANIGATITASSRVVGEASTLDSFTLSPIATGSSEKERFFPGSGDDDPILPPFKFIDESPIPDTSIANLEIYTIYTGDFGSLDPDLESISSTTGGSSFVAPNPNDLVDSLLTIISLPTKSADLELSLVSDKEKIAINNLVTLTTTLSNKGSDSATSIQVKQLLPGGFSFVSSISEQGSYDPVTGIWEVNNIAKDNIAVIKIIAQITSLENLVLTSEVIAAREADPDSAPNNNNPNEDDQDSITLNATPVIPALNKIADDVFTISGGTTGKPKLQITISDSNSESVNDFAVFTVDDSQGWINGIAPTETGYTQAALSRAENIFSAIANNPQGFDPKSLSRSLELSSGDNLRFLLVKNDTLDKVRKGNTSNPNILFSNTFNQKITDLGTGNFSLAWKDGSGSSDFKDFVVNIQATDTPLPLGANLQDQPQGEVLDLSSIDPNKTVQANFLVNREAAFNNFVGFYKITDAQGTINNPLTGIALKPGDTGYAEAAIKNRIAGIDLQAANQSTATINGVFQGGSIFAPFIVVNGSPDQLLDANKSNDPAVYFAYLGANSDGIDHIRLLGNNTFGFEDLAGGGDLDYNDIIIKANLSAI
jgi:uncharacterized repeat protein (TIGR01451 family)